MKIMLCVGLLLSISLYAASFDCTKDISSIEKLICSDSNLSELDDKLGKLYIEARDTSTDKEQLKKEQLAWIKERNRYEKDKWAMYGVYENRIIALQKNPPTSAEIELLVKLFKDFQFIDYGAYPMSDVNFKISVLLNLQNGKFELIQPLIRTDDRNDSQFQELEKQCPNVVKSAFDRREFRDPDYRAKDHITKYLFHATKDFRYYKTTDQFGIEKAIFYADVWKHSGDKSFEDIHYANLLIANMQTCQIISSKAGMRSMYQKFPSFENGFLRYGKRLLAYSVVPDTNKYWPNQKHEVSSIYKKQKVNLINIQGVELTKERIPGVSVNASYTPIKTITKGAYIK